jgi:hypothetical protein
MYIKRLNVKKITNTKSKFSRRQYFYLIFLVAIALLLSGCSQDPNVKFIQGVWEYKSEHLSNLPGESHLTDTWLFDRGTFKNDTCCFNKGTMQGKYSIVESEENTLKIELYDIQGDQGGHSISSRTEFLIIIEINHEDDTLEINHTDPYYRLTSP